MFEKDLIILIIKSNKIINKYSYMKSLYIIRHAKSSWKDLWISDFDRELNKRGKDDLEIIWNILKNKKIKLDKIFCSSAKRAELSCSIICKKIWYNFDNVIFDKNIYDYHMKGIDFYLWYIIEFDNIYNSVALIWHNDALTELVEYFLWIDIWKMPTSWVVKINFDIQKWCDISYWNWKKDFYIYPKMYK